MPATAQICANILFFFFFFPFSFAFSLHFANLITTIIIGTIRDPCFPLHFVFSSYPPNTCLVCLFVYTFVAYLKVGRYLHTYISLSSSPSLLCFAFISYEIEPNSPSALPSVRPSYLSIYLDISCINKGKAK